MTTTKYPNLASRKARDIFTKKLARILAGLDKKSKDVVSFSLANRKYTCNAEIEAVWVVGSYARGALTCGDLDLVVQLKGVLPPSTLNSKFLGQLPDVRAYTGTPEKNDSGIQFPEAVKVWEPGLNWAAAIDAIEENPKAKRFYRKSDSLPLRTEQLGLSAENAEMLVDMHGGLLSWSFIPLSDLTPSALTAEELAANQILYPSQQHALLPYIKGFTTGHAQDFDDLFHLKWYSSIPSEKKAIRHFNSTCVSLGKHMPSLEPLWDPGVSQLILMPELNVRGPNGIWVLKRGPDHPLTQALSKLSFWVLTDNGEIPLTEGYSSVDKGLFLEVFKDEAHVLEMLADTDDPEYQPSYEKISGPRLARALHGAQAIELYGGPFIPFCFEPFFFFKDMGVSFQDGAETIEKLGALADLLQG